MQYAKDTLYVTLRDRLAALNPARTVFLDGVTRPAVIVAENEHVTPAGPLPDAFHIRWGAVRRAQLMDGSQHPLLALECGISYWTAGTTGNQGVDRGRLLAALDSELLAICSPRQATKRDYTQSPALDLGTQVLWSAPELHLSPVRPPLPSEAAEWKLSADLLSAGPQGTAPIVRLERTATLTVFYFPEGSLS